MNTKRYSSALAVLVAAALAAGCGTLNRSSYGSRAASSGVGEVVPLSGAQEVPPTTSNASGTATVDVRADCSVTAKVTVTGMNATGAHIHYAAPGANGEVILPFTKTGENSFAAPPGAKFDEAQCAAYRKGDTYVNVHSGPHPGGELRAQLKGIPAG